MPIEEQVVAIFAGRLGVAEYLFAAGISDFRGAEFRGLANDSAALYLNQLVNQIQMGRIARSGERGADSERVNRGMFRKERGNARFIEIA